MKHLLVFYISAEAEPFVKVGGLGDVAGSLPAAIQNISLEPGNDIPIDIRLVIPFHKTIDAPSTPFQYLGKYLVPMPHRKGNYARVFTTRSKGVTVYLIGGKPIENHPSVYSMDTWRDGDKYVFFSKAALMLPEFLHLQPNIFHCNDWHTALVNYLLDRQKIVKTRYKNCSSIITIHNLPFMGGGIEGALERFGIEPATDPVLPEWSRRFPLPMGMSKADKIIAVSPNYARELMTSEFGCGLQEFLSSRKHLLTGIINGIDVEEWNPASDPLISVPFTTTFIEKRIGNKLSLQQEFHLKPEPQIPILAMVSRLDPQKGVDLIPSALRAIIDLPWQAILLGSGSPDIQNQLLNLAQEYPSRVKVILKFDAALSHRIYAGSDILLMPSRYEPCGLSQMIAMRYGCIPVAHATGGLVDTILDPSIASPGTGFLYEGKEAHHLAEALRRSLSIFTFAPVQWGKIQIAAMQQDFSWSKSAKKYVKTYLDVAKLNHTSGENE